MHDPLFHVANKVAVVTGGSGTLGGAMARALAERGAHVVVMGSSESSAASVVDDITRHGGSALGLAGNVTDRPSLEKASVRIDEQFGAIDILVNAAGGTRRGPARPRIVHSSIYRPTRCGSRWT